MKVILNNSTKAKRYDSLTVIPPRDNQYKSFEDFDNSVTVLGFDAVGVFFAHWYGNYKTFEGVWISKSRTIPGGFAWSFIPEEDI